jgi:hypothetical protein
MRRIEIALTERQYAQLREVSSAACEKNYSPEMWAAEVVSSELAARRLPTIAPGRLGARMTTETDTDRYRVVRPELGGVKC